MCIYKLPPSWTQSDLHNLLIVLGVLWPCKQSAGSQCTQVIGTDRTNRNGTLHIYLFICLFVQSLVKLSAANFPESVFPRKAFPSEYIGTVSQEIHTNESLWHHHFIHLYQSSFCSIISLCDHWHFIRSTIIAFTCKDKLLMLHYYYDYHD